MFKYCLYKLGQFLVSRLPVPWAYRFGIFLSEMQYACSFRDRRIVQNNLRAIGVSEKELEESSKEVFRNFGRYLVEFFRMGSTVDADYIKKHVTFKNLERLDEIASTGKGAIIMTGHIGNWELGAVCLSLLGYSLMAIALPHKQRPVNDLFNYQRERKGITVIPTQHAIRRCIETLRRGEFIAIVGDRDFYNTGIEMDFLGRPTKLPKGPAILAEKTKTPVIPTFLIRDHEDHFTMTIGEPVYPSEEEADIVKQETLEACIRKYAGFLEEQIRKYPKQWLMFRQFWTS